MKSRFEVEKLKEKWLIDRNYNIEETEGFSEYIPELIAFREKMEEQWKQEHLNKVREFSEKHGVDYNAHAKLAKFLYSLEGRITRLEAEEQKMRDHINSANPK